MGDMAKIFFNDKAVKTESDITILNWFTQKDGTTIFLRDTRKDTYVGRDFIYGEIDPYRMDGDYYVDILEQKIVDSTIAGVFITEGSDFEIITIQGREPLFVVRQEATVMALGMRPMMDKGIDVKEVTMGLFFEGTIISYNRDGVNIKDELTEQGWKRTSGPKDLELGVISTADAYETKLKEQQKDIGREAKKLQSLKESLLIPGINTAAVKAIIAAKEDKDSKNTHIFLLEDIKTLVEQGIL
jgi:hypothetical protein